MSSKSLLHGTIGFVAGAAVALLLFQRKPEPLITWPVSVGDATNPDDPARVLPADLRMAPGDVAQWRAYSRRQVYIEFENQIFTGMTYQSTTKRWRIGCPVSDVCNSNSLLSTAPANVWHKYWQGLADPNAPSAIRWADGRIMIVRP